MPTDSEALELLENRWRLSPDLLAEHLTRPRPDDSDVPSAPEHLERPPHIRLIARKVRECLAKPNGRLIVNTPPQHTKSTTITHYGTLWHLSLRPQEQVGIICYQAGYAAEWGRKIRNTIRDYGHEIGLTLAADSKAVHRFSVEGGGGVWTAGADGSITGRPAAAIFVDDPHKGYPEAHSPTMRERVWNTYQSDIRSRFKGGTSMVLVMTRFHEEDLTGKLVAEDAAGIGQGWEMLRLPAIAEEREEWDLGAGETWVREEGEPLWPDQHPIEFLRKIEASSTYIWSGTYQQRPAPPGGRIVQREWFEEDLYGKPLRWSTLPDHFDDRLVSVDCTFKGTADSDYVAIGVWGRLGPDRYLIHQIRAQMGFAETCAALNQVHERFPGIHRTLVENKANGEAVIETMRAKIPGVVPFNPGRAGKVERMHAVEGEFKGRNIRLPTAEAATFDVGAYIEEVVSFPDGKYDDQVDQSTQALLEWGALGKKVPKVSLSSPAGVKKIPPKKKRPPSSARR